MNQDRFLIPQHDTSSNYRCVVKSALSKMHILDGDPGLKLQHTLAEQVASESFKQLYNSLDQ